MGFWKYVLGTPRNYALTKNTEEILEELEKHVPSISYRTYYRKRQAAISALSSILWGFSAKGTLETLNKFFPN